MIGDKPMVVAEGADVRTARCELELVSDAGTRTILVLAFI